jgi:predicted NBD/HSP70 family sugar kinase
MPAGIRHDDLRRRNRAMVIAEVRRSGQPSRTSIANATGLSHSTISAISSDLMDEGILVETAVAEPAKSRRGRPQVGLGLNPQAAATITIVLSLNHLTGALIDYAGRTITEESCKLPTLELSEEELIGACISMVERLGKKNDTQRKIMRLMIAVQGITDSHSRKMLWSPITSHTDLELADLLEERFGIPSTVENDCNMITVALRWRDPDRYKNDFIAILLSHGIGMGLMLKGELFTGTHSSGVEFGHMNHLPHGALCRCGRRGCVEAYAGNYAIWRNAHGLAEDVAPLVDIDDANMLELAESARNHPGRVREAFHTAGEAIGYGLGSMFALIDPAPVAVVGIGAAAFDLIEPSLREAIANTAGGQHNKAISFAAIPDEFSLIREGSAMHALTHIDSAIFAPGSAAKI